MLLSLMNAYFIFYLLILDLIVISQTHLNWMY